DGHHKKTLLLNQESEAIILRRARLGISSNTLGLDVPLHLQQLADEPRRTRPAFRSSMPALR
ncbi:MAG: hypothetical protein WAN94_17300, partial [Pseudolabrys sp.]